jgi:FkbM family methyltransferase
MRLLESAIRPRPEYLYRPSQLWHRLSLSIRRQPQTVVHLPWGLAIEIDPREALGNCILRTGIHELAMTEALWRLTPVGGVTVDVGANVGYATGLSAVRQGPKGVTLAFEAHPRLFESLKKNVSSWRDHRSIGAITASEVAIWIDNGVNHLIEPTEFISNNGLSTMNAGPSDSQRSHTVTSMTLDAALEDHHVRTVDLLKIDIEGAETAVFRASFGLLKSRRIKHIVFEAHRADYDATTSILRDAGYSIGRIRTTLFGPVFEPESAYSRNTEEYNFIASHDASALAAVFQRRGWLALRSTATV